MEGPLLSNNEQRSITISDDSSSREEPFVSRTVNTHNLANDSIGRIIIASIALEFVMTLAQIITAIVLIPQAKGDHLEANWIIAYTFGCIVYLPVLCWTFWQYTNDFPESRIKTLMMSLKSTVQYIFVGWCLVFIWVLYSNLSSMDYNTPLFKLSVAFLAYSFARFLLPTAIGCCCVCVMLCFDREFLNSL